MEAKPEKNLGGQPTKFNPERCAKILNYISKRVPYELAAEASGICEDTLYEWIKIGRRDIEAGIDSEHARFSEAIKEIENEKIIQHMENINENQERWQAQAWILERRWHKYFGANAALIELNKRLDRLEKEGRYDVDSLKQEAKQITQK